MSKGEFSSLTSTMDDIARRVAALAEENREAGLDEIAIDLYEVERSIRAAVRRLAKLTDSGRRG